MKQLALLALSGVIAAVAACSGTATKKNPLDGEFPTGDDTGDPPLPPPRDPDIVNDDAGAFVGGRGKDGGSTTQPDGGGRGGSDSGAVADSSTPLDSSSSPDSATGGDSGVLTPDSGTVTPDSGTVGHANACANDGALSAGDLAVVEVMIASASGSGDRGEWFEVQSTRSCALNLNGLHVESPRGTLKDTFDITTDTWLEANGIFVIADSADATKNHDVPAPVYAWKGTAPADVLVNSGDTITITAGTFTIETFVYPTFQTVYPGRTMSFPSDCAWSDRSSWARWSWSFHAWSGNFLGTPNADNTDVACY